MVRLIAKGRSGINGFNNNGLNLSVVVNWLIRWAGSEGLMLSFLTSNLTLGSLKLDFIFHLIVRLDVSAIIA